MIEDMKKILLLLFVAFAVSANSNAQGLESVFGGLFKKSTKTETKTEDNDKAAESTQGKSLEDELLNIGKALLGDVVDELVGTDKITAADLAGIWNYNGIACELESDDMVSQIGAKVVTAIILNSIQEFNK